MVPLYSLLINRRYLPQENVDILKKFDALRTVIRLLEVWQPPTNKNMDKQISLFCENGFEWSPGKIILF